MMEIVDWKMMMMMATTLLKEENDGKLPPDIDDVCCGGVKIAYIPIVPFPSAELIIVVGQPTNKKMPA
jgi:hypothetical protein